MHIVNQHRDNLLNFLSTKSILFFFPSTSTSFFLLLVSLWLIASAFTIPTFPPSSGTVFRSWSLLIYVFWISISSGAFLSFPTFLIWCSFSSITGDMYTYVLSPFLPDFVELFDPHWVTVSALVLLGCSNSLVWDSWQHEIILVAGLPCPLTLPVSLMNPFRLNIPLSPLLPNLNKS